MKSIWQCVLVFLLFFIAATAVIQVDRQCREMTGVGGSVTAFADEAAATAVQSAGHVVESAAASAEFIVEKVGFLG